MTGETRNGPDQAEAAVVDEKVSWVKRSGPRFNLWRQRHGPVLPLVSGVLTLLAAAGVLVMLILGIFWGRPDNPNAFNWWAPISVVVLVLVAREWS